VIDLGNRHTRTVIGWVFVLTIVNVVIVSLAAFGSVHYMESAAFCGQTCHTTMEPQASAHEVWPHASVACTQCHVGPGAGAFLAAKLAGTRQLIHVVTDNVPKPVPSPQQLVQPASVTCVGCHSSVGQQAEVVRVSREYGDDETNTEIATTLRLHVARIHRHNALEIEFPATDKRAEVISYLRVRQADGTIREFRAGEGTDAPDGELRRMDCTDCHNRAAHSFSFTPQRAVDGAIARGRIPRELPFARREAVLAVSDEYPDRAAALDAIRRRLTTFYASRPGVEARLVERAVTGAQEVWTRNIFPAMNVTWGTYPNQLGHIDSPGCFRCHDDAHKASDGTLVTQDCELCHTIE
jgi:hypothetical protein